MYYFRCLIGAALLGVALQQTLHFVSGQLRFGFGDGLGILMTAGMAVLLFAPALLDVIRREDGSRRRGVAVLIAIGVIAAIVGVSGLLSDR